MIFLFSGTKVTPHAAFVHSLTFIRIGFAKKEINSLRTKPMKCKGLYSGKRCQECWNLNVNGWRKETRRIVISVNSTCLKTKRNRNSEFQKTKVFHTRSGLPKLCRKCCSCLSGNRSFYQSMKNSMYDILQTRI